MSTDRKGAIAIALQECGGRIARVVLSTVPNCVDCLHFDEKNETCTKWNARPPARVIAFGCDNFEEDIPF